MIGSAADRFERRLGAFRRSLIFWESVGLGGDLLLVALFLAAIPLTSLHFSERVAVDAAHAVVYVAPLFAVALAFGLSILTFGPRTAVARRADRDFGDEITLTAADRIPTTGDDPFAERVRITAVERIEKGRVTIPIARFGRTALLVVLALDVALLLVPRGARVESDEAHPEATAAAVSTELPSPVRHAVEDARRAGDPEKAAQALDRAWKELSEGGRNARPSVEAVRRDLSATTPESIRRAERSILDGLSADGLERRDRETLEAAIREARSRTTDAETLKALDAAEKALASVGTSRDAGAVAAGDRSEAEHGTAASAAREVVLEIYNKIGRTPPKSPVGDAAWTAASAVTFETAERETFRPVDRGLIDAYARRRWARSNAR